MRLTRGESGINLFSASKRLALLWVPSLLISLAAALSSNYLSCHYLMGQIGKAKSQRGDDGLTAGNEKDAGMD